MRSSLDMIDYSLTLIYLYYRFDDTCCVLVFYLWFTNGSRLAYQKSGVGLYQKSMTKEAVSPSNQCSLLNPPVVVKAILASNSDSRCIG